MFSGTVENDAAWLGGKQHDGEGNKLLLKYREVFAYSF